MLLFIVFHVYHLEYIPLFLHVYKPRYWNLVAKCGCHHLQCIQCLTRLMIPITLQNFEWQLTSIENQLLAETRIYTIFTQKRIHFMSMIFSTCPNYTKKTPSTFVFMLLLEKKMCFRRRNMCIQLHFLAFISCLFAK